MAAPAANEAQPQGPQVPRAPQANVVQHIIAGVLSHCYTFSLSYYFASVFPA